MNENEEYIKSLPEYAEIAKLAVPFFQDMIDCHNIDGKFDELGAEDLLHTWMVTENTALGGVMPLTMILMGRGDKLLQYVKDRIGGNKK